VSLLRSSAPFADGSSSDLSGSTSPLGVPSPGRPVKSAAHGNSDFTALSRRIHQAGLMRRRYGYYWTKIVALTTFLAAGAAAVVLVGNSWWQLAIAVLLAIVLVQTAFLGHDAGHRQIFKSGRWNDWVSLVIANLFVGISSGWWQNKHSRHHSNPNKQGADPDIDLAVLAFTPEQVRRHQNRAVRWLAAHQGWFFFPVLLLEGVSLHVSSIRRVLGRRPI
jgi:fatty acid desaturase